MLCRVQKSQIRKEMQRAFSAFTTVGTNGYFFSSGQQLSWWSTSLRRILLNKLIHFYHVTVIMEYIYIARFNAYVCIMYSMKILH